MFENNPIAKVSIRRGHTHSHSTFSLAYDRISHMAVVYEVWTRSDLYSTPNTLKDPRALALKITYVSLLVNKMGLASPSI